MSQNLADIITAPETTSDIPTPHDYTNATERTYDTTNESLEEKARQVAARAMDDSDIKTALDGAKLAKALLPPVSRAVVVSDSDHIDALNGDTRSRDSILQGLRKITLLTEDQLNDDTDN